MLGLVGMLGQGSLGRQLQRQLPLSVAGEPMNDGDLKANLSLFFAAGRRWHHPHWLHVPTCCMSLLLPLTYASVDLQALKPLPTP